MAYNDRVIIPEIDGGVFGKEVSRFSAESEEWVTVLLDQPRRFSNQLEFQSFVTVRPQFVRRLEPDGVTLNFTGSQIVWRYNGEIRNFSISENKARAFAAMAHIDKIQGIKSFRVQFDAGLKEAKDVIERLMLYFPR